ncbi:PREDICTED: uncharacterized protein LOC105460951 [Wasmannia auropunctata]|uniref:uncharacterized protein LOC105460951 n=1 Tax=Wasmannia auropunctata TaxID=64793 RepID=UPI0005ED4FC0|nr:PREDICTED: uncharacterized protein LOC105460951 [Wasmannia auropunctata]
MALNTSWLNQWFVEEILRKSESDDSIQVIDVFWNRGSNKGDNYSCDIIRITTEFSRKESGRKIVEKKSIIVKVSPIIGSVRYNIIAQSGCFHIEISMMLDTLYKMNELLSPKHRLSVKVLYVQSENPSLLVLEDLVPLGFRMADRESGLDLAHSMLAIRGIARFHAASVAVCEKMHFYSSLENVSKYISVDKLPNESSGKAGSIRELAEMQMKKLEKYRK